MTSRVHVHLRVSDLAKSRDFYERFLGSAPVKVKPGYVKFLPDWAPVNLALSESGAGGPGTVDHIGVTLESTDTVLAQLNRVKTAGLAVQEEMGVNCCHANQDKFWVQDPDGVDWEVYHLNYDLEDLRGTAVGEPSGHEEETVAPAQTSVRVAEPAVLPRAKAGGCCSS